MVPIRDEDVGVDLGALAARVRSSSNFRFEWRWFGLTAPRIAAPDGAAQLTKGLIEDPACHEFLRASFEPMYDPTFAIEAVHPHARFVEASDFHETLAQAAGDRLGAYSRHLTDADPADVVRVREAFAAVGAYTAFALEPGRQPGCAACKHHNSHLFTNWFYGVAWDWYFVVLPHRRPLAWIGLLTDTD